MSDRTNRRDFLKKTAAGAAAVALGGCSGPWQVGRSVAAPVEASAILPTTLVQVTGPGVPGDLGGALVKLLEPLGGMGTFVKEGQSVLLKPNMGFPVPNEHRANTSTALIKEVAKSVLAQGAGKVVVADFPVSDSERVAELMGLRQALKGLDVTVMPVTDENTFVEVDIPRGKSIDSAEFLKEALETDVHIALPIAKSHGGTGFTGTMKGMMGLIATRKTFHWRYDLHQAIVDLNTFLRPHLIIMDGLEVMTTGGPRGPGNLEKTDTLLAGTDPVAVDAAGIRLAPLHGKRIDPHRVKHVALAASSGLGRIDLPASHARRIDLPAPEAIPLETR